jgi:hypothetical protein
MGSGWRGLACPRYSSSAYVHQSSNNSTIYTATEAICAMSYNLSAVLFFCDPNALPQNQVKNCRVGGCEDCYDALHFQ